MPPVYLSFLVRMWREPAPDLAPPAAGWQAQVEAIQNGRQWTFAGLDDLLAFLRQQAEAADGVGTAPGPGS